MTRFSAVMRIPLIVSALLPLIVVPQTGKPFSVVVGLASWLVFLVDYIESARHLKRYRHTGYGRFDLIVVIVTAPWFLIPGAGAGSFVVVLRLARVVRLLMVSRGARRLFQQLGQVATVGFGVTLVASLVAYYAEHPTNPEFATIGDALWWGIVTLTTVGYGDIVPKTLTGRWAGVTIMITGIAVLGVLAGSLASFFRIQPSADGSSEGSDGGAPATPSPAPDVGATLQTLVAEVTALREQVAALTSAPAEGVEPDSGAGRGPDASG
jgi:voltage-gated potassium channel